MRGIALQRAEGYSHPPPLCFAPQNIGEVARSDGGVKNTRSESNRGGLEYKQAPDNRGGASWVVLLAVEKNEQIKRINVTRTFFDRERKSFVSQSSLAVPRMRGIALR